MRIVFAALLALVVPSSAAADTPSRAEAVVDALAVDDATAAKLVDVLTAHDRELGKLQKKRSEYKRHLVTVRDPKSLDRLLDEAIENQRTIAETELRMLARVRQLVPSPKAVQLMFLMSGTEPAAREPISVESLDDPSRPCNPFASMHRCR